MSRDRACCRWAPLPLTVFVAVAWALVSACGGERSAEGATWGGSVDTVGGVITVSNPATPSWSDEAAWQLEEELSIGAIEGDPNYQFSWIRHVEVDEAGNIYVLDGQARRLMIYDRDGVFLRAIGRQGEGPGEFENPARLVWKGDTLVVWDYQLRRLTYFDQGGELLRDERLDLPFFFSELVFRPDGRLWVQRGPMYSMPPRPETEGIGWILLLDLETQSADTLIRWRDESMVTVRMEQFMTALPRWYSPRLEWAAAPDGKVFVARGERYEIEVYSPEGERVGTIRREYTRYPPSAGEREQAVAWSEERAERYGASADRVRKAFEIADLKTAMTALVVADDGHLWVRVSTEDDRSSATWDVFDPAGRYLGPLVTPRRLTIHRITGDALYGVLYDEFDVPYVKRFAIRQPL